MINCEKFTSEFRYFESLLKTGRTSLATFIKQKFRFTLTNFKLCKENKIAHKNFVSEKPVILKENNLSVHQSVCTVHYTSSKKPKNDKLKLPLKSYMILRNLFYTNVVLPRTTCYKTCAIVVHFVYTIYDFLTFAHFYRRLTETNLHCKEQEKSM